ncbi:hypothetical protein M885DRAFT_567697 [Pelagophyceae sp. CCMP2097]|nr:hypothetical protein M885DRAFT_567697 [Pelagophyceae sp. CCMP2097]
MASEALHAQSMALMKSNRAAKGLQDAMAVGLTHEELVDPKHLLLPPPPQEGMTLADALQQRRRRPASCRDFDEGKLLRSVELSQVLFACQGVTAPAPQRDSLGHEVNARRTCPSGGAVYPLTVYVAAKRVEHTPPGVYRYCAGEKSSLYGPLLVEHTLAQPSSPVTLSGPLLVSSDRAAHHAVSASTVPHAAAEGHDAARETQAGFQTWLDASAALLVICGRRSAFEAKAGLYGSFATPLLHLEAGMAAQSALLAATAAGLAHCPVGAFDAEKEPLIIIALGHPLVTLE